MMVENPHGPKAIQDRWLQAAMRDTKWPLLLASKKGMGGKGHRISFSLPMAMVMKKVPGSTYGIFSKLDTTKYKEMK